MSVVSILFRKGAKPFFSVKTLLCVGERLSEMNTLLGYLMRLMTIGEFLFLDHSLAFVPDVALIM